jgi:peptidoglycan/xylan/chitin deacetylase (PgdA/CDA1 family)
MTRPLKTAKYLLRFDDICPTMNWRVWSEIESALEEHGVSPILAVVPDNQDPKLQVDESRADFWERVRQWQARGWTIALHGFQHKYVAEHRGIVTPRKKTEFAGVPAGEQEEKLRGGMEIFKREGIKPQVWIAPSNSFDSTTVSLLPKFGIRIISDGLCRFPFRWPEEMLWVPHQIFGFRPAPPGVWTVCYHHNDWEAADLARFRQDLRQFHSDIWTLEEVLLAWSSRRSRWSAWLCTHPVFSHWLIRAELKLWEWWISNRSPTFPVGPGYRTVE